MIDYENSKNIEKPKAEKLGLILQDLHLEICDRMDKLEDSIDNQGWEEVVKKKQQLLRSIIKELLDQKYRFKHVFETEKGSIYFVSIDDNSLRFKKSNGMYKVEPVLSKIIFVDDKESVKIRELIDSSLNCEKLIGKTIIKSKFKEGVTPYEFCLAYQGDLECDESDDEIVINGFRRRGAKELDTEYIAGIHWGHKVTKIY